MTHKSRILIHSMTFSRDYSTLYVLRRLLESMGHDCFIASNENYLSRWAKAFNPHAVLYVTSNKSGRVLEHFPNARIYFCAGEGGEDDSVFEERYFIDNPDVTQRLRRIFFWGQNAYDNIAAYTSRTGGDSTLLDMIESGHEKIRLVGHPRLDLLRFGRPGPRADGRLRVGLIGNCSMLNSPDSHPLQLILQDGWRSEMLHYGLDLARLYGEVIRALDPERHLVSIRPYPLEVRSVYTGTSLHKEGRFQLDDSLDFSTWLRNQDVVLGDISSTLVSVVTSGCRYVNISGLTPRSDESYVFNLVGKLKEYTAANRAESFDDLLARIGERGEPVWDPRLLELFDRMYAIGLPGSALMRIARDMDADLAADPVKVGPGIGGGLARAICNAYYRKGSGYSYFREKDVRARAGAELDPVAADILASEGAG